MVFPKKWTMLHVLESRCRDNPEGEAYTFSGQPCTYSRMWEGINRVAACLLEKGISTGDRVVLALPNGGEFFSVFYGAQLAGGVAVPLFPESGPKRIMDIARMCDARVLVVPSSFKEADKAELRLQARKEKRKVLLANEDPECSLKKRFPPVVPDDVAFIQYTSGSTGHPKGVQISHANLITNMDQMIDGMKITNREIFASWLPLYHDMGLILMSMVPFYLGTRLILLPTKLINPHPWLEAIQLHRATFTAAPDFAYRFCLRYVKHPEKYDLSSLRVALNAAEPVRHKTVEKFEERFGLENVLMPAYGLAEATVGVSMWTPQTKIRVDDRGFVSVGPPFRQVHVAIINDGREAATGRTGEIMIKSPANTRGYFNNPEETAGLYWNNGYIHTGDLGYLDSDGYLFIVGRSKNIIIHAGMNISPQEVEETVDELRWVRYSAAVGIDRGGPEGEQVYIFAEAKLKKDASQNECHTMVVDVVRCFQARFGFRPGRVYILAPHAIPMTHNRKLQHARLKEKYLDGSLRSEGLVVFPDY